MHFTVAVIIPSNHECSEEVVDDMLAPYDENLEVEPSIEHLSDEQITTIIDLYRLDCDDIAAIVSASDNGDGSGVDNNGIWRKVSYNLNGKWDYWSIIDHNPLSGKTVLKDEQFASAIITPDGVWHNHQKPGMMGVVFSPAAEEQWINFSRKTYEEYSDNSVVFVDCHV